MSRTFYDLIMRIKIPTKPLSNTANITVSVGKALRRRMRNHPTVNWSAVCRAAIKNILTQLSKGKS